MIRVGRLRRELPRTRYIFGQAAPVAAAAMVCLPQVMRNIFPSKENTISVSSETSSMCSANDWITSLAHLRGSSQHGRFWYSARSLSHFPR